MPHPRLLLAVLVGGMLGGLARYGVTSAFPDGDGFPWSTLGTNLAGSFLLAVLLVVLAPTSALRRLLGTGFCGAFTTFSAVTVATAELTRDGSVGVATLYLVVSVLGSLAAAAAGVAAARAVR